MKKRIMLLLAVLTLLPAAGCGKTEEDTAHIPTTAKIAEDQPIEIQTKEDLSGEAPSQRDLSEEEGQGPEEPARSEPAAGQEGARERFQFSDLSDRVFYFSSGAGGWFTELRVRADGAFEGHYQDSNMGDTGDNYPNGTLYFCDFYGTFDQLEKVDDLTYKMRLSDISFRQEPEKEEIIDGVRYIYSAAYGMDGEDFYLYLPGSRMADLPQAFLQWVGCYNPESVQEEKLSFYGLYNAQGELGFSSSVYMEQSLSQRIAMEITYAEERDREVEEKQKEAVTQMEMNETAREWYQLWDDTLNVVWELLETNLSETEMEALRKEEREWIAFKEAQVQEAGLESEGGSIQPLLEFARAAELTKERVYELAEYAK